MSGKPKRIVPGLIALAAAVLLGTFGLKADERSRFVTVSEGHMASVPVDDEMLHTMERMFGPGGAYSGNAGTEEHLAAMRAANRAFKMKRVYFAGTIVALLAAMWFLVLPWWRTLLHSSS